MEDLDEKMKQLKKMNNMKRLINDCIKSNLMNIMEKTRKPKLTPK
jgi:hypothetical protein